MNKYIYCWIGVLIIAVTSLTRNSLHKISISILVIISFILIVIGYSSTPTRIKST